MAKSETNTMEELGISNEYQYGFHDDIKPTFKSRKGLDEGSYQSDVRHQR